MSDIHHRTELSTSAEEKGAARPSLLVYCEDLFTPPIDRGGDLSLVVPDSLRDALSQISAPGATLSDDLKREKRLQRFKLQGAVNTLLNIRKDRRGDAYPDRAALCYRCKTPGLQPRIIRNAEKHTAYYRNMLHCDSVWGCPVCAARITEGRRIELAEALEAARSKGWSCALITLTIQHEAGQTTAEVYQMLSAAYRKFRQGKAWASFYTRYDIAGTVVSTEPTFGDNGPHPHKHMLIFSRSAVLPLEAVTRWVKDRWSSVVAANGGYASEEHGANVIGGKDTAVGTYIAKMGLEDTTPTVQTGRSWTLAHEVAKGPAKEARQGGRTPNQLLADYLAGDTAAGELWLDYYEAFKGQTQFKWSQGLREELGLSEAAEDSDIAEADEGPALDYLILTDELISALNRHDRSKNARGVILELCGAGDWEHVCSFVESLGLPRPYHPDELAEDVIADLLFDDLDGGPAPRRAATPARRSSTKLYDHYFVDFDAPVIEAKHLGVINEDTARRLAASRWNTFMIERDK